MLQALRLTLTPLATGLVDVTRVQRLHQSCSYHMHPAILDAMTHTGGALQNSKQSEQGVTRIPVAIRAFLVPSESDKAAVLQSGTHHCNGCYQGLTADGSALTDFYLAGSGNSVYVNGFCAKVVSRATQKANHPSSTKEKSILPELYAARMQAADFVPSDRTFKEGVAQNTWKGTVTGRALSMLYDASEAKTTAHVATALINGASILQQRLLSTPRDEVHLVTAGAPCPVPSCADSRAGAPAAAAAAICSLMKAASMEFPTAAMQSITQDGRCPLAQTAARGKDVFGAAISAGVCMRAKLLCQPASIVMQNTRIMPIPRGSFANLKLVPIAHDTLQPEEVKVHTLIMPVIPTAIVFNLPLIHVAAGVSPCCWPQF